MEEQSFGHPHKGAGTQMRKVPARITQYSLVIDAVEKNAKLNPILQKM